MKIIISFIHEVLNWSCNTYLLISTRNRLVRGCSQMTSSPEGEGGGKPKDDEWWQMMTGGRGGVEQKMTRIYHPSIQCLCAQSFNLPGVNIFQWWIFVWGVYFRVESFFRGQIFFQGWIFFRVNILQGWIFSGVNIFQCEYFWD